MKEAMQRVLERDQMIIIEPLELKDIKELFGQDMIKDIDEMLLRECLGQALEEVKIIMEQHEKHVQQVSIPLQTRFGIVLAIGYTCSETPWEDALEMEKQKWNR